ncbi:MAG: universal stress protein [Chloroflexi bacterium]|nr:universal stress protein [Chloroflexota bacterium]
MKILIAINGSKQSETTLRFAAQIVLRTGEPPTVLTVIDRRADRLSTQADEMLGKAQKILAVPNVITRVRTGHPTQEIIREAREGNHDLLIVGEMQANLLARLLLGSTEVRVAEGAPCPVIIVKGITRPIRRILLCDSGAGRSSVLSRFTAQLAETLEGQEEVTVLHVMSQISAGPGVPGRQLRASVDELIEEHTPEGELLGRDIQALEQPGIHPTPKVLHGLVLDEILTEARKGDYDLVVIGAHKGKKWQHFLLEDLTRKILVQSDRPVLVVK